MGLYFGGFREGQGVLETRAALGTGDEVGVLVGVDVFRRLGPEGGVGDEEEAQADNIAFGDRFGEAAINGSWLTGAFCISLVRAIRRYFRGSGWIVRVRAVPPSRPGVR